jgi:AcrR family transcriptional regulator
MGSLRPVTVTGTGGSRTRLPRQERRAQLLEVARQVFVTVGYHAASMDEIAATAGVSKPVLYQHFPGKLELYLALLDTGAADMVECVRAALESTHDNKQRVRATIGAFYDFVDTADGAFRLVFESDLISEPAVRATVDGALTECAELISKAIAEDAGLREQEARLLAVAVTGLAQVSARSWLAGDGGLTRAEAVDLISRLAWRGIRGFPLQGDVRP